MHVLKKVLPGKKWAGARSGPNGANGPTYGPTYGPMGPYEPRLAWAHIGTDGFNYSKLVNNPSGRCPGTFEAAHDNIVYSHEAAHDNIVYSRLLNNPSGQINNPSGHGQAKPLGLTSNRTNRGMPIPCQFH